ncbi:MAG TPA: hypothetical protein VNM90_10515, partial [Haliangium sp.]|nr:hypothetical protein [Haliangium sp.]
MKASMTPAHPPLPEPQHQEHSTVNRTPEQNREVSPASNANPAGRAGRTVYTLPVGALSLVAQRADDEAERGAMDALVADQAIDMRVD